MLRGLYSAASGMIAQQQRTEMLTNNLANAQTPGYKADHASMRTFPNLLIQALHTEELPPRRTRRVGELATAVYLQERMPNFRQGDLTETGNATDLALLEGVMPETETGRPGALFFVVQIEDGEVRYTRNGQFSLDGEGYLTTADGYYVLSTLGEPIQVDDEDFHVDETGTVTRSDGTIAGQLNVVYAEDPLQLVKEGNGHFRFDGEGELPTAIGNDEIFFQIKQRFLERANVDTAQTMADMIAAFRSFEANQRVLQAYDQTLEKAVNEIGKIG